MIHAHPSLPNSMHGYISKCHMKQILSRAPAAFFFHSYAYAQSISRLLWVVTV